MNVNKLFDEGRLPQDYDVYKSFLVTNAKFDQYNSILVSVSGGSDSDVMMDLFCRFDKSKITFVFFDTGLEYKATHEHLKYLEEKYGVEIVRIKGTKPIPITCRDYGMPFLSKQVSEYISRLQKYNFKWEDKSYDELLKEYCYIDKNGEWRGCVASLMWWCNEKGDKSRFNISYNKWLKEFLIANPPDFKISQKCCKYSKKDTVKNYMKENNFDLNCQGVRKAEGGVRSTAYKNCFSDNTTKDKIDEYRPIFWYKDATKVAYEEFFDVTHSKCYSEYGLKRTGCCGCPYGRDFEGELEILKKHEPNLHKAVSNIFGKSYEYTRKYRAFAKEMNDKLKEGR